MKYKALEGWSWFQKGDIFSDDQLSELNLSPARAEELVKRGVLVQVDESTPVTFERR